MLSSRISGAPASSSSRSWSERGHLDLHREPRVAGQHRLVGRHHPARREDVVVLDQRHVRERGPVVDAAAAAHGVLLQRAEARGRLAGVPDPGVRAGERVDPAGGGGRDAREVAEEVQRGALGGEQRRHRAVHREQYVVPGDPVAVGGLPLHLHGRTDHVPEDHLGDREPGDHPVGAGDQVRPGLLRRVEGGGAGDVLARQVLGDGVHHRGEHPVRVQAGGGQLGVQGGRQGGGRGHARAPVRTGCEGEVGDPGVRGSRRRAGPSARRRGPGSPRASASPGSPRGPRPRRAAPWRR